MRRFTNCLILLFFTVFLYSCKIQLPDKNDNGDGNNTPTPENPYPSDNAIGVSLTPQLSWQCDGSNGNNLRFDIYLDTISPPDKFIEQVNSFYYYISTPLKSNKTYYWKINAKNDNGESVSNIWRFTTISGGLPADGLVAYYPFNGNTKDESGTGNNGVNYGAFLTMDRFNNSNKAYSFNSSAAYISVPHSSSLQPTGGLTLSAWASFYSLDYTSSVLSKGSDTVAGWYSLRYESSGRTLDFQINFSDYIPGPRFTVSSSSALQTNTWYNVIGTFDGSTMKIYLNGNLENSIYLTNSLGSNYEYLVIGNSVEGYFLSGALDDIRIYNRAINDAEVQQLYQEGGWRKK